MQEEIQIKGESKRTIARYFTNFSGQTGTEDKMYFVITDSQDKPIKISDSLFDTQFALNDLNYNVELSAVTTGYKVYSGTVVNSEINTVLNQEEKDSISSRYVGKINARANPGGISIHLSTPFSTVFFDEYPFTDYFMNVKINKSVNSLDTLNVYNVSLNGTPTFSNNTGVLMGKLEAVQVLEDENGDKIRIPLKNTVVGIFNPSESFPNIASTDEEGNRIRLNLYETIQNVDSTTNLKGYSSFQSYLTDIQYSKNDIENKIIPEKYKYTTITNERGEFILHNLPVGQQTLMIEVDLLKFGLEPEEVALNFFPYPTTEDPNVSEVPHYFFGQYPINIVPSWGDFQTGYTEMTLSVSLDLRKWNTYYTFPISARYGRESKNPYILEELYSQGFSTPLTVLIRDMTKPLKVNDRPKVEIVKIPDISDKNIDLYLSWNSEYKTRNNKVEFDTTAFNAFKLPANLYDPQGTNSRGEKGVWLNAYTFKIYYADVEKSFYATGLAENWKSDDDDNAFQQYANHFDLNRADNWYDNISADGVNAIPSVGTFPYQKPWSLTYPIDYKITKKPSVRNPYKKWSNSIHLGLVSGFTVNPQLEPRFLDGDLVGGNDAWATNANGYGLQDYDPGMFGNMFARDVTKNEIWRYEAMDWWAEEWSNGYTPGLTPGQLKYQSIPGCPPSGKPDISADVAERFQRLESGYGYWLKPRGWPRINVMNAWGDFLLRNDANKNAYHDLNVVYPGYYSVWPGVYKYLEDITIITGSRAPWFSKVGRITAYRVEKPYYSLPKNPPFLEKFVTLKFGQVIGDGTSPGGGSERDNSLTDFYLSNRSQHAFFEVINTGCGIFNKGTTKVTIQGNELLPGERLDIKVSNGFEITLPANSDFNPRKNSFERAKYEIYFNGCTSSQAGQPYGPYSDWTGGMLSWYNENLRPVDEWWGSVLELFYHYDNKQGLPAFPEDDPDGTYYFTMMPAFPLNPGAVLTYTRDEGLRFIRFVRYGPEDAARAQSNPHDWAFYRIMGLAFMADHGFRRWGRKDPAPRWTRTHPKKYMQSYQINADGSNTGKYFRFLSTNGYNIDDLDFRNIP